MSGTNHEHEQSGADEHEEPFEARRKKITVDVNSFHEGDEVVFYLDGKWQKVILADTPRLSNDEHTIELAYYPNLNNLTQRASVVVRNNPRKVTYIEEDQVFYKKHAGKIIESTVSRTGETLYTVRLENGREVPRISESELIVEEMVGAKMATAESKIPAIERTRDEMERFIAQLRGKKRLEFMSRIHGLLVETENLKTDSRKIAEALYDKKQYAINNEARKRLDALKLSIAALPNRYKEQLEKITKELRDKLVEEATAEAQPALPPGEKPDKNEKRLEKARFSFEEERKELQTEATNLLGRVARLGREVPEHSIAALRTGLEEQVRILKKSADDTKEKKALAQKTFIEVLKKLHAIELQIIRAESTPKKPEQVIDIPADVLRGVLESNAAGAKELMKLVHETILVEPQEPFSKKLKDLKDPKDPKYLAYLKDARESFNTAPIEQALKALFANMGDSLRQNDERTILLRERFAEQGIYPETLEDISTEALKSCAKLLLEQSRDTVRYWTAGQLHHLRDDDRSMVTADMTEKMRRFDEWKKTSPFWKMKNSVLAAKLGASYAFVVGVGGLTYAAAQHILPTEAISTAVGAAAGWSHSKSQELLKKPKRDKLPTDATRTDRLVREAEKWLDEKRDDYKKAQSEAKKEAIQEKRELIVDGLLKQAFIGEADDAHASAEFTAAGLREMAHLLTTVLRRSTVPLAERVVKLENDEITLEGDEVLAYHELLKSAELEEGLELSDKTKIKLKKALHALRNNTKVPGAALLPVESETQRLLTRWASETLLGTSINTEKKTAVRKFTSMVVGGVIGYAFSKDAGGTRLALGGYYGIQRGFRDQFESETGQADLEARTMLQRGFVEVEALMIDPHSSAQVLREYRDLFATMLNARSTALTFEHIPSDVLRYYQTHAWDVAGVLQRDPKLRTELESLVYTIERSGILERLGIEQALETLQLSGEKQQKTIENAMSVRWGRAFKRYVRGAAYGALGAASSWLLGAGIDWLRDKLTSGPPVFDRTPEERAAIEAQTEQHPGNFPKTNKPTLGTGIPRASEEQPIVQLNEAPDSDEVGEPASDDEASKEQPSTDKSDILPPTDQKFHTVLESKGSDVVATVRHGDTTHSFAISKDYLPMPDPANDSLITISINRHSIPGELSFTGTGDHAIPVFTVTGDDGVQFSYTFVAGRLKMYVP